MTMLEKAVAALPIKGYLNMEIPKGINLVEEINKMKRKECYHSRIIIRQAIFRI